MLFRRSDEFLKALVVEGTDRTPSMLGGQQAALVAFCTFSSVVLELQVLWVFPLYRGPHP